MRKEEVNTLEWRIGRHVGRSACLGVAGGRPLRVLHPERLRE